MCIENIKEKDDVAFDRFVNLITSKVKDENLQIEIISALRDVLQVMQDEMQIAMDEGYSEAWEIIKELKKKNETIKS